LTTATMKLPDEPQTLRLIAYAIVNTSTNSIDSEGQQLLHEVFVHGKHWPFAVSVWMPGHPWLHSPQLGDLYWQILFRKQHPVAVWSRNYRPGCVDLIVILTAALGSKSTS
jgi:hypothetical protein